jgi:hypothetical protein
MLQVVVRPYLGAKGTRSISSFVYSQNDIYTRFLLLSVGCRGIDNIIPFLR